MGGWLHVGVFVCECGDVCGCVCVGGCVYVFLVVSVCVCLKTKRNGSSEKKKIARKSKAHLGRSC